MNAANAGRDEPFDKLVEACKQYEVYQQIAALSVSEALIATQTQVEPTPSYEAWTHPIGLVVSAPRG